MGILLLCIIVNSTLGILFKVFSKYEVDLFPAIVFNYFVALGTAAVYLGEWPIPDNIFQVNWFPYAFALGILFITFFNVIGISVQKAGLVVTTIFQKMSLLAPAVMGILLFQESKSIIKIIGIFLAILSIILVSSSKKNTNHKIPKEHLMLAFLVFIGSAIIDALLYWVDVKGIVTTEESIQFVSTPFLVSGIVGVVVLIISRLKTRKPLQWNSLWAGVLLGIPNFFSIYLILKTLSVGLEGSVVFPVNNIGILLFSALVGILAFKESANRNKLIGFALAILAIVMISYG